MLRTSLTLPRRLFWFVPTVALFSVCLCADVAAQTPVTVLSSSAVAVPHNEQYGAPWQSAVSNRGDFVLLDFKTTGLYEYPANGAPEITLGAQGVIAGGFNDSGIAIDPRNNNIYLDDNYNNGLLEFPFDPATGTWDLPSVQVATSLTGNLGGSCGNYFQSAGLSMNDNGVLAVATENGCGVEIFTVPIDTSGNFGPATPIVSNMKARAKTVALDDAGNISFNEDSGGVAGVLFIPAGTTGLADDSSVLAFFNVATQTDSMGNVTVTGNNVQGVTVDKAGNLYVADGNLGEFMVPLVSGVPNPNTAVLLSPALASGGPSLDVSRGILYVPTSGFGSISDLVDIYLNRLEFGAVTVPASAATASAVNYYFTASTTPYSFTLQQDGASGTFAIGALSGCGITFTTDSKTMKMTEAATTYAANATCALPVSFSPTAAGDSSATLSMLDASGNVLNTTVLHGSGLGSAVLVPPGTESAIGSGLQTPTQVAVDAAGNVYVADSGLGKILSYPKGSTGTTAAVTVGTGLTAPTGVAVDGSGDVFIADSGNVIEVPYGTTGLNAAGQVTLKTGLGTNLRLAADAVGDIFVADPDNQRVVRLRTLVSGLSETDLTGFSTLSAIAADGSGDLFVANGANLVEVSAFSQQTLLNSLSGVSGLAVDASGSVYVTSASGTVRIPNMSGTLTTANQLAVAPGATAPTSVAIDPEGNAYVTDGTTKSVDMASANGFLNFGTLTTTSSMQSGTATIVNGGTVPLNITGFASTADYSETATTCIGAPIGIGSSCTATLTFNPGPGDQGTLLEEVLVQSDAVNAPIGVNVTGVGAPLAASTTTLTVTNPSVTSAPVAVTVASKSGTGPTPTGNVNLVVTAKGAVPVTLTAPLVNGEVTLNATEIQAGSYTFTVNYIGDRVYGTSSATTSVTIASGAVMLVQPAASTVPTYVLAAGTGSQEPYDGSQVPYYYNYPVTVKSADGNPLIGIPIYNSAGTQVSTDYGTVTYLLANGTAVCPGTPVNADGTAPLATNCFTIDTSNNQIVNIETSYTVTPMYTGNSAQDYASSTGTPVTFIALRNPSVTITSDPASITVMDGSSATATLTLTSLLGYGVAGATSDLNNYSLPLELECDGLPAHASCSFSYPTPDPSDPNSVDVNVNAPGTVMMTINTNVPVGTTTASLSQSPTLFASLFGFGLIGLAVGRKKLRSTLLARMLCLVFFSGAVLGLAACSSADISVPPTLTTPGGAYMVTVTAKQVGSKSVPGSTPGTTVLVQGNGNQMSIPFAVNVTVQ